MGAILDYLSQPFLLPFTVAAGVLVVLVLIEALSIAVGASASAIGHHEAGLPEGHHGFPGILDLLAWLNPGRVPMVALLVILLAGFSVIGFAMAGAAASIGYSAPPLLSVPVAALLAMLAGRPLSRAFARVLPSDETYAVDQAEWIGWVAEITTGPASAGQSARARLQDRHGNWHFPLVEPMDPAESLPSGTQVVIVAHRGRLLQVVRAGHQPMRPS